MGTTAASITKTVCITIGSIYAVALGAFAVASIVVFRDKK